MNVTEAVTLSLAALCLLGTISAALYIRFSGPIVAKQVLQTLLERVKAVEADLEAVGLRWDRYREEVQGLLEQLTETEQRTERNRRRVAATEQRLKQREGNGEPDLDDHTELRRLARAQGYQV